MMYTPDGRECPYYYADFHRRDLGTESCRLLESTPDAERWHGGYCARCPVPGYRRANACSQMQFRASIGRRRFWEAPQVLIRASCAHGPVKDPAVGCGHCHPPLTFVVAENPPEKP